MRTHLRILSGVVILLAAIMLLVSCGTNADQSEETVPVIQSLVANPDTVLPGRATTITCNASDPDGGPDTLSYTWIADFGTITELQTPDEINWTAPDSTGSFSIEVRVSDGDHVVGDSVVVVVSSTISNPSLDVRILSPLTNSNYAIGDTIDFNGRVFGLGTFNAPDVQLSWTSSIDGLLNDDDPDSNAYSEFSSILSQGTHTITFSVIVDGIYQAVDDVIVNVQTTSTLLLHPIHREYLGNRLTWDHETDSQTFNGYTLYRQTFGSGLYEIIAVIDEETTHSYFDSTAILGQTYNYTLVADYGGGLTNSSTTNFLRTGVFTEWSSEIPDMVYDGNSEYLYISTPDLFPPQVNMIDVTANNPDGFYWYSDSLKYLTGDPNSKAVILFNPMGFAINPTDRAIYIASIGDISKRGEPATDSTGVFPGLWRIDLSVPYGGISLVVHTNFVWRGELNFASYDDSRQVVYATTDDGYPLIVDNPEGSPSLSQITDSRLVYYRSLPLVDETNGLLYISELGSFPASLWKYNITGITPVLLLEDQHNTLGYNLQDLALSPDRTELYLANESPEYIQVISTADFTSAGSFLTGSGASAIHVMPDGSAAYFGVEKEVQKWDLSTDEKVETWEFKDPVIRGGIQVSDDQQILMVATWDSTILVTRLFIIYLY
ncbi:MAG: hypothetical protein V2A56_07985 [bacterium]